MDYNRARANVLKNVSMVTFFLLNPEREVSTIAILVSFNGKKYRRSIHESIPVNLWNNDKKRVRVSAKYQQGNIINDTLSKWEVAALRTLSHFKEYYNAPSKDEFFEVLDREFYKDEVGEPTQKEMLFLDYLQSTSTGMIRSETPRPFRNMLQRGTNLPNMRSNAERS